RLFLKDLLLGLAEEVRPPGSFPLEIVAIASQLGPRQQGLPRPVRHLDPFEIEEDEMLVDGGPLLAGAAEQGPMFGVIGLAGVKEVRVDNWSIHLFGEALQLADGGEKQVGLGALVSADLAAVGFLKGTGTRHGRFEVLADLRVVHALVEIAKVPRHPASTALWFYRLDHALALPFMAPSWMIRTPEGVANPARRVSSRRPCHRCVGRRHPDRGPFSDRPRWCGRRPGCYRRRGGPSLAASSPRQRARTFPRSGSHRGTRRDADAEHRRPSAHPCRSRSR